VVEVLVVHDGVEHDARAAFLASQQAEVAAGAARELGEQPHNRREVGVDDVLRHARWGAVELGLLP